MKADTRHVAAAVVTLRGPGAMTKRGRTTIAMWLRKTADDLEAHGTDYTTGTFRARYMVADKAKV